MAYLLRKGHVDTVVTEDSDLLVFGCKEVLFKLLPCGTAKRVKLADVFIKVKALEGWTQSMFRHMCILASDNSVPPPHPTAFLFVRVATLMVVLCPPGGAPHQCPLEIGGLI